MEDNQVSQEGFPTLESPTYTQDTLFSLEELTVKSVNTIESLNKQIKEAQQMVTDAYERNTTYVDAKTVAKEAGKKLNQIKEQLTNGTEIGQLVQKVKDMKKELKEKQVAVSDYGLEYVRLSGVDQIEKDGQIFDIVRSAKLVKRSQ